MELNGRVYGLANNVWAGFQPFLVPSSFCLVWAFPIAQLVKNLPAMPETPVRLLGQKDPLEKGMATHSSILGWRIPWAEEPGGLQSVGSQSATQLSNTTLTALLHNHYTIHN